MAVSVDSAPVQLDYASTNGLNFPLVPDTKGHLMALYEALNAETHLAAAQSVLIDKAGVVRMIDKTPDPAHHGHKILAKMQEIGLLVKPVAHFAH